MTPIWLIPDDCTEEVDVYVVPSLRSPSSVHRVSHHVASDRVTCDSWCAGFLHRGDCRHVRAVRALVAPLPPVERLPRLTPPAALARLRGEDDDYAPIGGAS